MKPGFYPELRATYHADPAPTPSLSSSIAKIVLNQTPRHAWVAHSRLNPNFEPKDSSKFDLGAVAHELLLGAGGGFEVIQANDWRTKAAQERRDEAYKAGKRALLEKDFDRAVTMANEVGARLASMGIMLRDMETELPFFWQDAGVWCRAMADAIDRRAMVCFDIKTTSVDLSDTALERQIDMLGYDLSAGHYIRGLERLMPKTAGRWRFYWIFVEANEPHEMRVIEANRSTLEIGDRKAATALVKWSRALTAGEWPGYAPEITSGGISEYAINRWTARELVDPDCAVAPYSALARPVEREAAKVMWGAG